MSKGIPTDIFCSSGTGIYLNAQTAIDPRFVPQPGPPLAFGGYDAAKEKDLWYRAEHPYASGDADIMNASNAYAIRELLKPYIQNKTAYITDQWIYVKAFTDSSKSKLTDAYDAVNDIYERLDDYPILDEEDFSSRELDAEYDLIVRDYKSLVRDDAPENWAWIIQRWYGDHVGDSYLHYQQDADADMEMLRSLKLADPETMYEEMDDGETKEIVKALTDAIEKASTLFAKYKSIKGGKKAEKFRQIAIDNVQKLKDERYDILLYGLPNPSTPTEGSSYLPGLEPDAKKPSKDPHLEIEFKDMEEEMKQHSLQLTVDDFKRAEKNMLIRKRYERIEAAKRKMEESENINRAIESILATGTHGSFDQPHDDGYTDIFASTFIRIR